MNDANITQLLEKIAFNADGLVPVIAQKDGTNEVLMMAWMSREAFIETMRTKQMTYWSRSRKSLWRKGESSGNTQRLKEMRIDCDGDTILLLVDQEGVACHTGRRACFYRAVRDGELIEIAEPLIDPEKLYG